MTAEPIAKVIHDLRTGRVDYTETGYTTAGLLGKWATPKVIDATAYYESLIGNGTPVDLYADHPCIAPPSERMDIGYVNAHGNVHVITVVAFDRDTIKRIQPDLDSEAWWDEIPKTWRLDEGNSEPGPWVPAHPVEWSRVKWIVNGMIWLGGRGDGNPMQTTGPMHLWRFAVYEDGSPADLHWIQLVPEFPITQWDNASLVLLGTLNFLNCNNVELLEPRRDRAAQRRLARLGTQVYELNVFPPGRRRRTVKGEPVWGGQPLASVRGHFASYGEQYNRGLLFGKLSGRFWIPQHARGSAEYGEHESSLKVRPK